MILQLAHKNGELRKILPADGCEGIVGGIHDEGVVRRGREFVDDPDVFDGRAAAVVADAVEEHHVVIEAVRAGILRTELFVVIEASADSFLERKRKKSQIIFSFFSALFSLILSKSNLTHKQSKLYPHRVYNITI